MSELVSAPKRSGPVPPALRKEVAEIFRGQWWVRALLATEHDKLGLILRAAMAKPTEDPPWLGPSAIVDPNGMVLSNWVDEHNHMTFAVAVCTLEELVNHARDLCDQLRFTQLEAAALFATLRQWVTVDARPETEQPEDRVPLEYRKDSK